MTLFTWFLQLMEVFTRSILVSAGVGALLGTALVCIFSILVGPMPTLEALA